MTGKIIICKAYSRQHQTCVSEWRKRSKMVKIKSYLVAMTKKFRCGQLCVFVFDIPHLHTILTLAGQQNTGNWLCCSSTMSAHFKYIHNSIQYFTVGWANSQFGLDSCKKILSVIVLPDITALEKFLCLRYRV